MHTKPRRSARRCAAGSLALVVVMSACTTTLDGPNVDYRSDVSQKRTSLDVPPDLSQLPKDDRYVLPEAGPARGGASASQLQRPGVVTSGASSTVAAASNETARIERDGNQRWLVVGLPPEKVWPVVRDFWIANGFTYRIEEREIGVLETNWAEDRGKMPRDLLRRTLGSIVSSLYDTGERDLFRTRLERRGDATEVYVTHRGAVEVLNAQKDGTLWQPRQPDPNLEAEFLQRMLVQFGLPEANAKLALTPPNAGQAGGGATAPNPARARLEDGATPSVLIEESFDRAWRRVGLSLDRTGFTVEDRDRLNGLYGVRVVDVDRPESPGFFGRIFGSSKDPKTQQFRIIVRGEGANTRVTMLDRDGKPASAPIAKRVLGLLADDLR